MRGDGWLQTYIDMIKYQNTKSTILVISHDTFIWVK